MCVDAGEKGDEEFMTITESAVVQRIRRKLRNTTHMLRKARGERQQVDCGRFYVIDTNLNALLWHHVDLEAFARELGVLRADETVSAQKVFCAEHCCPRRDEPVAWPAENTLLGWTLVGYLVGGLRFELSRPVQVIPKPR